MILPKSISQLHADLLDKKYSCVELVDAYLERINKYNPKLNAFLTVTDEVAYEQAKKADELIAELGKKVFDQYPLLGVVISYKDIYLTRGIRTTAASKVLEGYIPQYSSTVYEKLSNAGSIIIGKTNCDAWAHGASGENSDFGPTHNPWNLDYVPGGSSSGSAVSVSSDMSLLSTGTDTGGSIRQPAGFTNTVGFKPTYGAVSRYGVIAMASSLDSMGLFGNNVEDIQKTFAITRGPDGFDSTVAQPEEVKTTMKKKIGIPKEYFSEGLDSQVEKKVKESIDIFKQAGYEIVEVSLPHTKYAIDVYYIVMSAEVSSNLGRFDGVRFGNDRDIFGAEAKRRIMLGTYVLSAGYYDAFYLKAMKVRSLIVKDFEKAFSEVDALMTPVSPTPPFKLGEKVTDPLSMYLADIYSVAANLAGIPGLTLSAGFTTDNLPVGFQIMGPRFGEEVIFNLGKEYQEKTDWHKQKPNL